MQSVRLEEYGLKMPEVHESVEKAMKEYAELKINNKNNI